MKTNILDIYKGNDGKYSIRAVMAFLIGTVFSICNILDSTTTGVSVDPNFNYCCVSLILGLIASRLLQAVLEKNKLIQIRKENENIEQTNNP